MSSDIGEPIGVERPESPSGVGRILRSGATYAVVSGIQRFISLVMFPIYARVVDPEEYGQLSVLWSVRAVLAVVLAFGLETYAFRMYFELAKQPERRNQFIRTMWIFLLVAPNAIALVLAVGGIPLIESWDAFPTDFFIMGVLSASVYVSATVLPLAILRAEERLRDYVKLNVFYVVVHTVLMITLILVVQVGARGWVISNLAAAVVSLVVALRLVPIPRGTTMDSALIRRALIFGLPLVPHALSHWALSLSDRIVLTGLVSKREIGIYSIGYQVAWIMGMLVTELNRAVLPEFGRTLSGEARQSSLHRVVTHQVMMTFLLGLGVALVGPPVLDLVLPATYAGAGEVIPWVALGGIAFGLYYVPMNTLVILKDDTRWIWVASLAGAATNVLLNIWLVPRGGILAAAMNTAVGYSVLLCLVSAYALKMHGHIVTPEWGPTLKGAALVGVGYAAGVLLAPDDPAVHSAVAMVIWIAVAVVIAVKVMGIRLSRADLRMILHPR